MQNDVDIFELVKSTVDIVQYIESETGSKVKKTGSTCRINPCPLCSHNECFTLYPSDNSFHCFSCTSAGDVISFEMLHKHLPDNLEAARSIARKVGIPLDGSGRTDQTRRATSRKTKNETGKQEEPAPSIEPARANALRGIAAGFYHDELLSNEKALAYQMETRGHSLEILKQFQVGYAGRKSLIKHAKELGYSPEDLSDVGLVKKLRKGFVPVISQGLYIYPHKVSGQVLFFSLKDPTGKLKYQIKKKYAGPGWLCLNQDAFATKDPLIIVEGENDLLSVIDKAKQPNAIAVIGNFNTPAILAYLRDHAKDRTFYLAFDNDPAGVRYTARYAQAINSGGGDARAIEIPQSQEGAET